MGCTPCAGAVAKKLFGETGSRVLPPKKRDVIAYPNVMREEALKCIQAAGRSWSTCTLLSARQ